MIVSILLTCGRNIMFRLFWNLLVWILICYCSEGFLLMFRTVGLHDCFFELTLVNLPALLTFFGLMIRSFWHPQSFFKADWSWGLVFLFCCSARFLDFEARLVSFRLKSKKLFSSQVIGSKIEGSQIAQFFLCQTFPIFQPCTCRHQHKRFPDLQWYNWGCTLLILWGRLYNPRPRRIWQMCYWLLFRWRIWCQRKTFQSLWSWSSLGWSGCRRFMLLGRHVFQGLGFWYKTKAICWYSFHVFFCWLKWLWRLLNRPRPTKYRVLKAQPTHRQRQPPYQSWHAKSGSHTHLQFCFLPATVWVLSRPWAWSSWLSHPGFSFLPRLCEFRIHCSFCFWRVQSDEFVVFSIAPW